MTFRVPAARSENDPAIIEAKEKRYDAWLDQLELVDVPDLTSYFAGNLFRGGRMHDFRLSSDLKMFQFKVIADEAELDAAVSKGEVKRSPSRWFTCTFRGMMSFRAVGAAHAAAFQNPEFNSVFYDRAEINTLEDELRRCLEELRADATARMERRRLQHAEALSAEQDEKKLYSLIIETVPDGSLELVFASVSAVVPSS